MSEEKEGIWLSIEEYNDITNLINNFSNMQRLSSVILWLGIIMIILHIGADIIFHF